MTDSGGVETGAEHPAASQGERAGGSGAGVGLRPPVRVELFATLLLGLATLGSSWSAYRSTWWRNIESIRFVQANSTRAESLRASTRAAALSQIDVSLFVQWIEAKLRANERLAAFLESRFRAEFIPAFEAWRARGASRTGEQPAMPPGSPFQLPEYQPEARREAERLARQATGSFEAGEVAAAISTNYMVAAVMFAAVLFLAGTAIKVHSRVARGTLLALASVLLALAVAAMPLLPTLSVTRASLPA
jgi:hypothetical protein